MGLPISELPRQLEAEVDDWVWPGDPAVDAEASDLDQWARHGGTTGLVIRQGETPTKIRIGPLGDRAHRRVLGIMQRCGDATYVDEAFRYGCRGLRPAAGAQMTRIDGIPALSDASLDALGACVAAIPWRLFHAEMLRSMGSEVPSEITKHASDREEMTLPFALGMVVLARTFRAVRGHA